MGVLDRLGAVVGDLERRAVPKEASWNAIQEWIGGGKTKAGVSVTEANALRFVAVWACIQVIAQDIAKIPLILYQRRADGGKDRVMEHPHYDLLHNLPDPKLETTSYSWRLAQQAHLLTWGNAYARQHQQDGFVTRMEIIPPAEMEPKRRSNGEKFYMRTHEGGRKESLNREDVLHLKGLGQDGLRGYSPVRMAREAIASGLAADAFAAKLWGSGAHYDVVAMHPSSLSKQAQERLALSIDNYYRGLDQSFQTLVLEEGLKVEKVSMPPEEAQFLQTRQFSVVEIARIYRVAPHKIQELTRATFSNIEHQAIEHQTDTLMPWAVCWEQQLNVALLTPAERRQGLFFEFLLDGVARADLKSRYEAYWRGIQASFLKPDEVRVRENLAPEGGAADQLWSQLNMLPISAAASQEPPDEGDQESDVGRSNLRESRAVRSASYRHRIQQSFQRLLSDVGGRLVRREVKALRRILNRVLGSETPLETLQDELERFYKEFGGVMVRELAPVLSSMVDMLLEAVGDELGDVPTVDKDSLAHSRAEAVASGYMGSSRNQLEALVLDNPDEIEGVVGKRLDEWEDGRAEKFGLRSSVEQGAMLTKALYSAAGIAYIRWIAIGKSCPYCSRLHNMVSPIGGYFLQAGSTIDPEEEGKEPLKLNRNLPHAPAHNGCDCLVGPA